MIGREKLVQLAKKALSYSDAEQTEVRVNICDTYLSRYANNTIHQNIHEDSSAIDIKVVNGKRIGVASTNQFDESSIKRTVDEAIAIAKLQRPNSDFVSLPEPQHVGEAKSFSDATDSFTPENRAREIGKISVQAIEHGMISAGAYSTIKREMAVVNSLGVEVYQPITSAELTCTMMSEHGQGFASRVACNVENIDAYAVGKETLEKCLLNRDQIALNPEEYPVILDQYAVADLIRYLAYMGLNGSAYQEGRSFMSGEIGKQICGSNITIWDDGSDIAGMPIACDTEGVPKRKVLIIENGVARNVVYNSFDAKKYGVESTGHAPYGLPGNLFLKTGSVSKEEMIASAKRAVYITRFHYVRVVNSMKTTITGMTRGGTFLVEDGKISRAIKNLRFTDSVLDALSCVEAIGNDPILLGGVGYQAIGGVVVPRLKLKKFRFTGVTEH